MKNILYFLLFVFALSFSQAQSLKIIGTVTDSSLPLPGVNVVIEGTSSGTQTDFDGKYTIMVNKGDVLVFSYLGMITVKHTVKKAGIVDIQMKEDAQALEEVVVRGYEIKTQKVTVGYAVTPLTNSAIVRRKLRGRIRGIATSQDTKRLPDEKSTNTETDEKLYIVDGMIVDSRFVGIVKNLPSDKIREIKEIDKNEAVTIYGNTARNGCIIITTKNGNYSIENDEAYARILENKFKHTALSPLSTFSIDVDKAGYSNIRRMINNGEQIPVDAVKIEEMINYFDYAYRQPKGDHPFAIQTDLAVTPWNRDTRLVRIGLQGKKIENKNLPPFNLVFLIDVSGSMNASNKLPLLKAAFKLLVYQLREQDRVSIVVYAGAAGVVLEPTSGADKQRIIQALDQLKAGGSTAGGEGIELAYELASKHFRKNGNNRVILATDGDFNVGASSNIAMEQLIEEKRKSGVFLSVLGFGMGNYKDSKLEILADKGNGNHAYIDTMQEAQLIFGKEFGGTLFTIAKDVKIQVEFNPALVQGYRLIGYENRLLNDEDFIDDTKDAGELGSGHTVTALYEIIPTGTKSEYLNAVNELKYSNKTGKNLSDELLTVKFRYKRPDEDTSIEIVHVLENEVKPMSTDFSFAAAVGLYGMHLRKSAFTNKSSVDMILQLSATSNDQDKEGYRAEFIRLVKSTYHL